MDDDNDTEGTEDKVAHEVVYVIPYRIRFGRVEILDVIHAARRWPSRF